MVHFLTEEAREKYELEKLWTLGRHHDDQYQSMLSVACFSVLQATESWVGPGNEAKHYQNHSVGKVGG